MTREQRHTLILLIIVTILAVVMMAYCVRNALAQDGTNDFSATENPVLYGWDFPRGYIYIEWVTNQANACDSQSYASLLLRNLDTGEDYSGSYSVGYWAGCQALPSGDYIGKWLMPWNRQWPWNTGRRWYMPFGLQDLYTNGQFVQIGVLPVIQYYPRGSTNVPWLGR
jgi:hypothetical protein